MSQRRPRIVVLASGAGSNAGTLFSAINNGVLAVDCPLLVSHRAGAGAVLHAVEFGIPTCVLSRDRRTPQWRDDYDRTLAEVVCAASPDLVLMLGWMHIVGQSFLDRMPCPVWNLHPALPGAFPGIGAIERAWAAGQAGHCVQTGVMVHLVEAAVDAGPVVGVRSVALEPSESLAALSARMQQVEHTLVLEVVAAWAATHFRR